MPTKITGLTPNNTSAIRDIIPPGDGSVTTTATTATFYVDDPVGLVRRKMGALPDHRGHPYASLHAVVRKLRRANGEPV